MDTESIRLFVLAADKLNISAAGRELGMAPAGASVRLAKLEKTLGADLLRRSTRKVALSLEGAEFLPYAREILAQEDAAQAALGRGNVTATGTLRFTAPSTFAQLYIAPILPDYRIDDQTALWLVYPKSNVLTAKVRIFIDFLLEKIGSSPVWMHQKPEP